MNRCRAFSQLYQSLVPDDEGVLVNLRLSRTRLEDGTYSDTYVVVTATRLVTANVTCHSIDTRAFWLEDLVEMRRFSEFADYLYEQYRVNHERLDVEFRGGRTIQFCASRDEDEIDDRVSKLRQLHDALSSTRKTRAMS